jgi:hypothetical protein
LVCVKLFASTSGQSSAMSQLGTILCKSQLHNIVPAANEAATMAKARAGQAVGRHAKNKFLQKTGTSLCKPTVPDDSDCAKPAKNGQAVHVRKQADEPGSCMTRNEDRCLAQVHRFADRHNSISSYQLQRPDPKQDFFNTIGMLFGRSTYLDGCLFVAGTTRPHIPPESGH